MRPRAQALLISVLAAIALACSTTGTSALNTLASPSVAPSATPTPSPVAVADPIPQSITPLDYTVEAVASINRTLTVMTLDTLLAITAPAEGLSSLKIGVVARRLDAWRDVLLEVDGVARPFIWNSATGMALLLDFAEAPWLADSTHTIRVVGSIDWRKSTDSQGQLRRVGSGNSTVLTAGDILPLPMADPRRSIFSDPLSAPVARTITLEIRANRDLPAKGLGASGELIAGPTSGTGRSWTYRIEPARSSAFFVAPSYGKSSATFPLDGEDFTVSVYGPSKASRATDLATAKAAVIDLWSRFGPGPYHRLRLVSAVAGGFAHEYPGMVVVGANFVGANRRHTIRHEAAHQWWQSLVATDQGHDPWMDEALAEWSAARLDGATSPQSPSNCGKPIDGPNHKDPDYYQRFFGDGQYYDCVYKRGARLFFAIGALTGLPELESCLADYAAANRFGAPSASVLVTSLRDCAETHGVASAVEEILDQYLSPANLR